MQKLLPDRIWELEQMLAARPDAVRAMAGSPERFEILAEAMKRGDRPPASRQAVPHVMASLFGIRQSLQSVDRNPATPRAHISEPELAELVGFARSAGVDSVGYARLEGDLVFQRKAVLHGNAIVLTMEMDKESIDTSPSERSFVEVHKTYHHLGRAANQIAGWLRERGYSAQAGHPLNGQALYPPLAQRAGLGWRGLHGLLVTPKLGPRVRLAAVFTSIENLPLAQENDHGWIEEYCERCKLCARECPPQAILDQPLVHANGLVTCIVSDRCFPYFVENYGCSICIRVCPFQRQEYSLLKSHVSERLKKSAG
ncbi:MAG: [Fe-S]-binding protein [Anaerolineae bacterium]|nr:[Fe-S]-binding protein [Anaerolineae bacterium]